MVTIFTRDTTLLVILIGSLKTLTADLKMTEDLRQEMTCQFYRLQVFTKY